MSEWLPDGCDVEDSADTELDVDAGDVGDNGAIFPTLPLREPDEALEGWMLGTESGKRVLDTEPGDWVLDTGPEDWVLDTELEESVVDAALR